MRKFELPLDQQECKQDLVIKEKVKYYKCDKNTKMSKSVKVKTLNINF